VTGTSKHAYIKFLCHSISWPLRVLVNLTFTKGTKSPFPPGVCFVTQLYLRVFAVPYCSLHCAGSTFCLPRPQLNETRRWRTQPYWLSALPCLNLPSALIKLFIAGFERLTFKKIRSNDLLIESSLLFL
jgi:hypothetical protein